MEPQLRGYQLIGDNILFRFAEQILEKKHDRNKTSVFIGLCISGVKASDLLKKVKAELHPIREKVILMVGTNDIIHNTDSKLLRTHLHNLVYQLCFKNKVKKLIVITIPPVPRVVDKPHHWKTLKEYNEHIKTFHNGKDIMVIDAYPFFIKNNDSYDNPSPIKLPPCSTNEKIYSNSVGGDVMVSATFFEESNDGQEEHSKGDGRILINTKSKVKRKPYLPTYTILRRESLESKYHNNFGDDFRDNYLGENYFEEINLKYFKVCFENKVTRPDNINLNNEGLRQIEKLINDVIDK